MWRRPNCSRHTRSKHENVKISVQHNIYTGLLEPTLWDSHLPDSSTSRAQSACRAARFPHVNEQTPAHRRSAWATRGLASHPELPKMVGTIPTYIVYDIVTQCFGHELLSGAMRFSEEPNDRLHWLRTEGPGTFRLQGNVSGHCRLMGAQSLTCLEYFRTLGPDRFRIFSTRNSKSV